MKKIRHTFFKDIKGSIAVESALLTAIVVSVLLIGFEVSKAYRRQNIMHRATATLAEMVANDNINTSTMLAHLSTDETKIAIQTLFLSMLEANKYVDEEAEEPTEETEKAYCIELEYFDEGDPTISILTPLLLGPSCPVPNLASEEESEEENIIVSLNEFATVNAEVLPPYARLIRLKTFYTFENQTMQFRDFIFPTQFTSEYIAVKKTKD